MEGETYITALFVHLQSHGKPGWMRAWSISRTSRRRRLGDKGADAWPEDWVISERCLFSMMGWEKTWENGSGDRVFLQWSGDVFQVCGPRVLTLVAQVLQVNSNASSALTTEQKYLTGLQEAPAYSWQELPPASESKAEPTPHFKVPRTPFLLLLLYKPSNLITAPPPLFCSF